MHPWLASLRHDLVKRALWPARDLRDSGSRDVAALRRGLLELTDARGATIPAVQLWQRRRAGSPCSPAACDAFEGALVRALQALELPWPEPLEAVLALESAFEALARSMEGR
ncbi:MAG: hypothetical protein E6J78_01695 [Deltaproteobacteria bacterium]|nr:MAG: hypothetical protein E6J78_01695 [Deltaproteobacteria bacterium]